MTAPDLIATILMTALGMLAMLWVISETMGHFTP